MIGQQERFVANPKKRFVANPKKRFVANPKERFVANPKERFVANPKKRFVANQKKRFVANHLFEKMEKIKMGKEKEIIVTWSRASNILPSMVGHTFGIHNGKEHIPIYITESMIDHKLGEFAPTRNFARDARNDNDKKSVMKNKKK